MTTHAYDCAVKKKQNKTKNVQVQYVYHCCLCLIFDQNKTIPKAERETAQPTAARFKKKNRVKLEVRVGPRPRG